MNNDNKINIMLKYRDKVIARNDLLGYYYIGIKLNLNTLWIS
jgi:hypothetical protein